jgi:CheY-like chemotaxis protein
LAEIDAVVTDLAMPRMDGATLIRAVRRMKPSLPIIASTGYASKANVSELHVNAVLNKPYRSDALLGALHSALCGAPASPPAAP